MASQTAHYQLHRALARSELRPSASWSVAELAPGLILMASRAWGGWHLCCSDAERPHLPQWLAGQLVELASQPGLYHWSRAPFRTRRELLEALRLQQEQSEVPSASTLSQVLA